MLLSSGRIKAMRDAADAEDDTDKHVVTPGPLLPARETYGAMLLLQGKFSDALAAFQATLRKEPNPLGAMLGAGKATEGISDKARALQHYRAALALAKDSPPAGRPNLSKLENLFRRRQTSLSAKLLLDCIELLRRTWPGGENVG
jgi:tetratricopeptide (TPR) repeat protein